MAVPDRIVTNADLEAMVDTSDAWIVERTGISQRHIAAPDETSADLATTAALAALADAGWPDARVDIALTPPWSTDWMSDAGRRKLRDYGIAPPGPAADNRRADGPA